MKKARVKNGGLSTHVNTTNCGEKTKGRERVREQNEQCIMMKHAHNWCKRVVIIFIVCGLGSWFVAPPQWRIHTVSFAIQNIVS